MTANWDNLACPSGSAIDQGKITLAHGEGGRLTRQLIARHIVPVFHNSALSSLGDAAVLPQLNGPLAFTTDSFVVSPLFFPGGDIGKLAVFGTVNDLVVSGARPRWLSLSLIIEEGLLITTLDRIIQSIAESARTAEVEVVTGDTKVVPRGAADQIFINSSGVGELIAPIPPGPSTLQPGDEIVVTGPIGRHGAAILASRENFGIDPLPCSDCAPLSGLVDVLRKGGCPIRAMRDATRGGVAAVLHEWAEQSRLTMSITEGAIPITDDVRGVCELLGLDPLHIANEGTMVVAVPAGWGERTVSLLRTEETGTCAAVIGTVMPQRLAPVIIRRLLGTDQPLDDPPGSPLPRIC